MASPKELLLTGNEAKPCIGLLNELGERLAPELAWTWPMGPKGPWLAGCGGVGGGGGRPIVARIESVIPPL